MRFAIVAAAGVVWVGVLQGVFVAVLLTLAHLVIKVSRPEYRIMGWHPERDSLVSLRRHPDARLSPQITVFLFEGPVMFLNAEYFRERVLAVLADYPDTRWLVLNAAYMMDTVGNKVAKAEIAMIKVLAPNTTLQVIDWAMQAHGGAGVSDDFPLAMMYAHSRTLRFADGPDEVHRNAIAKLELSKHMSVPKSAKTA